MSSGESDGMLPVSVPGKVMLLVKLMVSYSEFIYDIVRTKSKLLLRPSEFESTWTLSKTNLGIRLPNLSNLMSPVIPKRSRQDKINCLSNTESV